MVSHMCFCWVYLWLCVQLSPSGCPDSNAHWAGRMKQSLEQVVSAGSLPSWEVRGLLWGFSVTALLDKGLLWCSPVKLSEIILAYVFIQSGLVCLHFYWRWTKGCIVWGKQVSKGHWLNAKVLCYFFRLTRRNPLGKGRLPFCSKFSAFQ